MHMLFVPLAGFAALGLILAWDQIRARQVARRMREFPHTDRPGFSRAWTGEDGNRWCMNLRTGAIVADRS